LAKVERFDPSHHIAGGRRAGLTVAGMVANAPCPAVATDPDNRVVEWNATFADLVGHDSLAKSNLQNLLRCSHPNGNPMSSGHVALHEMARDGTAPAAFEIDISPSGRAKVRVDVSVAVIIDRVEGSYRLIYFLRPRLRRRKMDAILENILVHGGSNGSSGARDRQLVRLTRRQGEVLRMMAIGATAGEIANDLGITTNTVRSHIRGIFDTLGVTRQTEAVARALREGLI